MFTIFIFQTLFLIATSLFCGYSFCRLVYLKRFRKILDINSEKLDAYSELIERLGADLENKELAHHVDQSSNIIDGRFQVIDEVMKFVYRS